MTELLWFCLGGTMVLGVSAFVVSHVRGASRRH